MHPPFLNRAGAGRALARRLVPYAGRRDVVVLGLPRGGVVVAAEVADRLRAPLDVFLVRKLGVPNHEEFAFGAIASGDVCVINDDIVQRAALFQAVIAAVIEREQHELARRERVYRGHRPALELADKVVIVVDDGIATGATMEAALTALRQLKPARLVVAAPVAAAATIGCLQQHADEVVTLLAPEDFQGVGQWYESFNQTSDREVIALLDHAQARR
jgi:putative phosphoribosyl transferase